MQKYLKKIQQKIQSRNFLEYIIWKTGLIKAKEIITAKFFRKENKRWLADNGDVKLRFDYKIDNNGLIMDIGSYTGNDFLKFTKNFECTILGFEPNLELFTQLKANYSSSSIQIFNFGFSDRESSSYLIKKGEKSFIKNSPPSRNLSYEKVELKKLSDFIVSKGIHKISLVNMNIEGSEYKVLNDLIKSGTINRIESLQVQFHRNTILYPVKAYLAVSKLKKTHKLIWDYKFVWARWDLKSS